MGNIDAGLALHHPAEAAVDFVLADRVQGGSGLVQDDHRGVLVEGPGDGQLLPLAAGELHAVLLLLEKAGSLSDRFRHFSGFCSTIRTFIPAFSRQSQTLCGSYTVLAATFSPSFMEKSLKSWNTTDRRDRYSP